METVFAAFVVIFLLLTGALTLGDSMITAQDAIASRWQEMNSRADERARTRLDFVSGETYNNGDSLYITLLNTGTTALADFDEWDVIVQYRDVFDHPHIDWLPYTANTPFVEQWSIETLRLPDGTPETYEPHILNPGEEAIFSVKLTAPADFAPPLRVTISTPNGVTAIGQFNRNAPPSLVTLNALIVGADASILIDTRRLQSSDTDTPDDQLIFSIIDSPLTGTLSLPTTFTQADITMGRLVYQHTGSDPDQFSFTVTDGQETIGPFVMYAQVSDPPEVITNLGAIGDANSAIVITSSLLGASDPDDLTAGLRYTVIVPPVSGYLNLGTSFTQGQIDEGLLAYVGGASDQFQFTLTDGKSTVGPFTFLITVTP